LESGKAGSKVGLEEHVPLIFVERGGRGSTVKADRHQADRLLRARSNPLLNRASFRDDPLPMQPLRELQKESTDTTGEDIGRHVSSTSNTPQRNELPSLTSSAPTDVANPEIIETLDVEIPSADNITRPTILDDSVLPAIAKLGSACQELFESLTEILAGEHGHKNPESLFSEAFYDQLGRFRLWAANIGALSFGRASLDYRLRDAEYLQQNVLSLLTDLKESLEEGQCNYPFDLQF
jgi:hypothetical protein